MEKYHQPALLNESMDALCIDPDGIVVDATFGGGGHSREILKRLNKGRLIAFDQDPDAAGNAIDDERFLLLRQNFRYLKNNLKYCKAIPIQALIADIGLSSHQVDIASRGFSMNDASPLDMRMNPGQKTTAAFILNNSDEEKLTKILSEYGEVPGAHKAARAIVKFRSRQSLESSAHLKSCLFPFAPRGRENKFFARVYQAIRIEVNDELNVLKEMLRQCADVMKPGGRLVVISYHSLEDRIVKRFINTGSFDDAEQADLHGNVSRPFKPVNRKVITPEAGEIALNKRARSAKMRVAERI